MMNAKTFHFFTTKTATRFQLSRKLLELGWQGSPSPENTLFNDKNLVLDDEISKNLEYKHLLANLIEKYCPDVMPRTYYVNDENYESVFARIIYNHYMVNNVYQPHIAGLKWILKPSMLNNGDEIKLFNNIEELKKHYQKTDRLGGDHVIQQYISNPDLIDGKKYTFRVAAVLTNYAGVFLYKQGYINISALPFTLEDGFVNRKAHITNYVLDGEFAHVEQRSTQTLNNFPLIYQKMCEIVVKVLKGLSHIAPLYLAPSQVKKFEIFGFDFILDQQGKVWLLEINQSPDAPTFEYNVLDNVLWNVFWQDIVEDFVLPISLCMTNTSNYDHFTRLLKPSEVYSKWRYILQKFIR